MLDRIEQARVEGPTPPNRVVAMLRTLLTGPSGMAATADLMARIFVGDVEGYDDLVVELGEFSASCVSLLDANGISTTEAMLKGRSAKSCRCREPWGAARGAAQQ
ncbi:hypothetical protein ACH4TX_45000 [Streptomyces sp. NPDC021098]|uniref:hypothetical protein n=1 Tax=unclassified Streptomyces TaxID=2593676 RepID=UPI0037AD1086